MAFPNRSSPEDQAMAEHSEADIEAAQSLLLLRYGRDNHSSEDQAMAKNSKADIEAAQSLLMLRYGRDNNHSSNTPTTPPQTVFSHGYAPHHRANFVADFAPHIDPYELHYPSKPYVKSLRHVLNQPGGEFGTSYHETELETRKRAEEYEEANRTEDESEGCATCGKLHSPDSASDCGVSNSSRSSQASIASRMRISELINPVDTAISDNTDQSSVIDTSNTRDNGVFSNPWNVPRSFAHHESEAFKQALAMRKAAMDAEERRLAHAPGSTAKSKTTLKVIQNGLPDGRDFHQHRSKDGTDPSEGHSQTADNADESPEVARGTETAKAPIKIVMKKRKLPDAGATEEESPAKKQAPELRRSGRLSTRKRRAR